MMSYVKNYVILLWMATEILRKQWTLTLSSEILLPRVALLVRLNFIIRKSKNSTDYLTSKNPLLCIVLCTTGAFPIHIRSVFCSNEYCKVCDSLLYNKGIMRLRNSSYSPTSPVIYMVILAVQRSFSSLSRTVTSCTTVVLPLCRVLHSI